MNHGPFFLLVPRLLMIIAEDSSMKLHKPQVAASHVA